MKKLLLFLLISNLTFSQPAIEIRLVNPNIGNPVYVWDEQYIHSLNTSTDAGLNTIFSTFGITNYESNEVHPYQGYAGRITNVRGNISQQFIDALSAYSSVVQSAKITNGYEFTDSLMLKLNDLNVGTPSGISGNIIVTNDTGLNTIFQNFNVFYYAQAYPSASGDVNLLKLYYVVCDCDKNLLNVALSNYNTVVNSTMPINGGVFLSNHQFGKSNAIISPNPFSDNFSIETNQIITDYTLFDITGKTLIATSDKTILNNLSSQLSSGIYILNLTFDNGQKTNFKLVKK